MKGALGVAPQRTRLYTVACRLATPFIYSPLQLDRVYQLLASAPLSQLELSHAFRLFALFPEAATAEEEDQPPLREAREFGRHVYRPFYALGYTGTNSHHRCRAAAQLRSSQLALGHAASRRRASSRAPCLHADPGVPLPAPHRAVS
eukprot:7043328-Prymnesium_polylepis.1